MNYNESKMSINGGRGRIKVCGSNMTTLYSRIFHISIKKLDFLHTNVIVTGMKYMENNAEMM